MWYLVSDCGFLFGKISAMIWISSQKKKKRKALVKNPAEVKKKSSSYAIQILATTWYKHQWISKVFKLIENLNSPHLLFKSRRSRSVGKHFSIYLSICIVNDEHLLLQYSCYATWTGRHWCVFKRLPPSGTCHDGHVEVVSISRTSRNTNP